MAKLKTLKEAGEATGIGLSTIRKYLSEFGDLIPVEKGPRNALLFSTEAVKVLKTIREAYQDKRTHEEIIAKLSGKRLPRRKKEEAVQAPVKKAATRRKKAPAVPAPAPAANLNREETIMKGYEDQQTDQGLW